MICPGCQSDGVTSGSACPHCGASLPADAEALLPLTSTTDGTLLPVLRSLLEMAGIPHIVQGEAGMSLFPVGAAGARVTRRLTGATILVPAARLEEARALLAHPVPPEADAIEE